MLNKMQWNRVLKKKQMIRVVAIGFAAFLVLVLMILASKKSSNTLKQDKPLNFTGMMDTQFQEADGESALMAQQLEVDSLKKQLNDVIRGMKAMQEDSDAKVTQLTKQMADEVARVQTQNELKVAETSSNRQFASNDLGQKSITDAWSQNSPVTKRLRKPSRINTVSYHPIRRRTNLFKNPTNYVPSGSFARATILGGADADASVDGQNKNNGVMLFKIISQGVLPNGKRSHLAGCIVTASAYGDISSERAYAKLDKISCAFDNSPIVDKAVTGWVFFGGKVGIKGVPMMREGKVVTWAGVSGMMSGVAQAAQYAQSVQNFGAYGGATSIVPSSNIGPFAAYGGASKAADQLSQYYIKRAEQYHPIIQVGSGNEVDIVFKDGFYFQDEPEPSASHLQQAENNEPMVPQEVLSQINQAQLGQELSSTGAAQ